MMSPSASWPDFQIEFTSCGPLYLFDVSVETKAHSDTMASGTMGQFTFPLGRGMPLSRMMFPRSSMRRNYHPASAQKVTVY